MPCSNFYCISNTGIPNVDDNYTLSGVYNSYDYWSGSTYGYYIYYVTGTSEYWCVSSSLGGSCTLFGASPCISSCPDICDTYFSAGVCVTPTPTPTVNCTVLDFTAIFDCEVSPSPTNTPTETPSPTLTPTPSVTNYCPSIGINVTITGITPSATSTLTPTPTASPVITYYCNFSGDVSFITVNSIIQCPGSKKFQDCYSGEFYYTTSEVNTPSGDTLTQFMIFESTVDGVSSCISYVGNTTQTIGVNNIVLIDGPLGYSNLGECALCLPQLTQTPTLTPTLTQTPTLTPTPTTSLEPYYYLFRNCDETNQYIIQTSPSFLTLVGQTLLDVNINSCWEFISQSVTYPSLSPFYNVTYFEGNYFSSGTNGISYNSCPDCANSIPPSPTPTTTVTPTPTLTPTTTVTPTPSNLPCIDDCTTFIAFRGTTTGGSGFNIQTYQQSSNTLTLFGNFSNTYTDIANSTDKLWLLRDNGVTIEEYDISFCPVSFTLNRIITSPTQLGSLFAYSNTILYSTNIGVTPNKIITLNITSTTAGITDITTLPTNYLANKDIMVTDTGNKIIVLVKTPSPSSTQRVLQYSSSGILEFDINVTSGIPGRELSGIFEELSTIYLLTSDNSVYKINNSSPYALLPQSSIVGLGNNFGASQTSAKTPPYCIPKNFI